MLKNRKELPLALTASVTDEVLLSLIANGNQLAFSILYKRYCPRLQQLCARMLKDDVALAADMVDETMFAVWRSAIKFRGKSTPQTWIYSISRNTVNSYLRKYSDSKIDKNLLSESLDKFSPSTESVYIAKEKNNMTHHISKLTEHHRDVLFLTYFKELSVKEIAITLNISKSTVKTRLFYARKRLKKILLKGSVNQNMTGKNLTGLLTIVPNLST